MKAPTLEEVPKWILDREERGHIVMSYNEPDEEDPYPWVKTLCGMEVIGNSYPLIEEKPERVCLSCRINLEAVHLVEEGRKASVRPVRKSKASQRGAALVGFLNTRRDVK
jgi:hypothetical protein